MADRPVTMRDVARAAGVSPKTVSNVVNGFVHVAPATRAHVQQHVEELGYRPHAAGRQLRRGRSGVVALAVPAIGTPYFADLAHYLVAAARRRGLTVLVEQTDGEIDREREVAAGLPVRFADGLVFSPLALPLAELEAAARHDTPLVLVGEHAAGHRVRVDRVGIDSVAVARLATEHLLAGGRRTVAMLGRKPGAGRQVETQRVEGWSRALRAAGREPEPRLLRATEEWHREAGAEATTRLLAEIPEVDAVFAANDMLAVGVLTALHRAGRRVPDDVAVVGVDDVPEAAFCNPALTTVAIDRAYVAETALELLIARMQQPDRTPVEHTAPHRLVVRASSGGLSPGSRAAPGTATGAAASTSSSTRSAGSARG